jgi:hypothetical protein
MATGYPELSVKSTARPCKLPYTYGKHSGPGGDHCHLMCILDTVASTHPPWGHPSLVCSSLWRVVLLLPRCLLLPQLLLQHCPPRDP